MPGDLVIRWTIRLAMVCFAARLVFSLAGGEQQQRGLWQATRWVWTLGCLLFIGHVLAGFHFYHGWSHAHAFADTAEKVNLALGVAFGWGIYANHLFLLVWVTDVAWMWLFPQLYQKRPQWVGLTVQGYLLFIALNGLVIFKSGVIRWTTLAALALLTGLWLASQRGKKTVNQWQSEQT